MKCQALDFPFRTVLSLVPLIKYWDRKLSDGTSTKSAMVATIHEELKKAPELSEPIEDPAVLEKHRELVDMLLSIVFPPAFWDKDCSAAFVPFQCDPIFSTPVFKRLLMEDGVNFENRLNLNAEQWAWGRTMKAYTLILRKFYDIELPFEYPLIVTASDPETGLNRFLSISMDTKFIEVKNTGELKPLSSRNRERLLADFTDTEMWMKLIVPQDFEFSGFVVFRAVDVTDQEVLSSLKRDLIEKESIFSQEGFVRLQEKLKIFLQKPDLILGLAAFQGEHVLILNPELSREKGCIFQDSVHCTKTDYEGSIYAKTVEQGEPLVIDDLRDHPERGALEELMIERGVRSVFLTPLYYRDKLLGVFDLKSPHPGALNALNTMKLWEMLPLFSMALNRGMDELNQRVQGIIKEKCTAIHPSVEWRFQRAALNFIQREDKTLSALEPIVFRDVYPLYGVSDIRGSSEHRNVAIQADLMDHLNMAEEIIRLANKYRPLPILDALAYQIGKNLEEIKVGLKSGDETSRLDFIRYVVEPVFDHIRRSGPEVGEKIEAYRAALDPALGTLYRKRKDLEESISLINETIASYLVKEQEKAQAYFPHYFEKMKTDGVDHTMYIGASMVKNGDFNSMYLKNLRLWQLLVMCGVTRMSERLKATLKVPLDTTHLILVHDTPLSIRFRQDEKRFDVDGAYDIRHEIIKKRIDKAMIKGKSERLTQPGKIAVVYSHRREALEYREYIEYLESSGYLKRGLEHLDLQDLQGVQGLKALRVEVNMEASFLEDDVSRDATSEAVNVLL